jgi:hypothetical protein
MITLRSIPLYFAPIVAFALIVAASLSILFPPPPDSRPSDWIGLLQLASIALCAYTAGRLYRRREAPDLRVPFFLNAAGLAVLLGWFVVSLLSVLWQTIAHRAA